MSSCTCVLLDSQFKLSLAAVAGSVALFTHCKHYLLYIPYSRLISQGANFRVFRESGLICEKFFLRKFMCLWKVTRKRDRVSFLALCHCKAKFYMSLHHFMKSFCECVLQYRSRSCNDCPAMQTDLLRFYVPVHTVVALQLLLPKQRYMCGSLKCSFLLQKSPIASVTFARLLRCSCALNRNS